MSREVARRREVRRHGNGPRLRVLAVVPFEEEEEWPFGGLLQAEAV